MHAFDDSNNNGVDDNDALKFNNFNENLSIKNSGKNLSIENRKLIQGSDTFFYNVALRTASYQLQFVPENIQVVGNLAYLEDLYLNNRTLVSLTDTTLIDFAVNSDAGSYASNRFRLVFNPMVALPLSSTEVAAAVKDKNVLVSWTVSNEINVANYSIERSADGIAFSAIGNKLAFGNAASASYEFTDLHPITGVNYYRIKSTDISGENTYSKTVKVNIEKSTNALTISPNPISANHLIMINVNDLPSGNYDVALYDFSGRKVFATSWKKTNNNNQLKVQLPSSLPAGEYRLCIENDSMKLCESLLIN